MPYKIEKQNNLFVVINSDNGHVAGKHKTKDQAIAQLGALYANVKDASQKSPPPGHPFYGNQYVQLQGANLAPQTLMQGWSGYDTVTPEFHRRNTEKFAYEASLTDDEKQALSLWGGSSRNFAKLDRGEEVKDDVSGQFAKKYYGHFLSAVNKAPIYNGTIYRGMGEVPADVLNTWTKGGIIQMKNHASSTYDPKIAENFMGGTGNQVLFTISGNKSGRNILEMTRVTNGGKSIAEKEVITMPGAKYRIKSWTVTRSGENKPLDLDWYFEGTEYSKNNLPEDLLSSKWGLQGKNTWSFELEDVS